MNKTITFFGFSLCALMLGGCDTVRNTFGLNHYQPNELETPEHLPLSMPPHYSLDAPKFDAMKDEKKTRKLKGDDASEKAKSTLLGTTATAVDEKSSAGQSIVSQASADTKADPEIRDKVSKEKTKTEDAGVTDKIVNAGAQIIANAKNTSNETTAAAKS